MYFGRTGWGAEQEASYRRWRDTIPFTNNEIADAYVRMAKRAQPLLARAYLARATELRHGRRLAKRDLLSVSAYLTMHDKFARAQQAGSTSQQDVADYLKVTGRQPSPE